MNRDEAYKLGYRHGSDSELPNTQSLGLFQGESREAYFEGYIKGTDERDARLNRGEGHVPRPDWMTNAQFAAIANLYQRSPDGAKDRHEFFTRVQQAGIGSDRYAAITWCGMYVGIEPDGYSHT